MFNRLKWLLAMGLLAVVANGCELSPDPSLSAPPLTKAQTRAVLGCQHTIKTSAAVFMDVKVDNLGNCADKILALQLALENGLITQKQFDTGIQRVRQNCLVWFDLIGQASRRMVNAILESCAPVEDIITGPYDPLQFVALGVSLGTSPFGLITDLDDIVRYTCLGGEVWIDTALWFNVPRIVRLLDAAGLDLEVDIPLDSRCFNGV